jgi:hypothetical protein
MDAKVAHPLTACHATEIGTPTFDEIVYPLTSRVKECYGYCIRGIKRRECEFLGGGSPYFYGSNACVTNYNATLSFHGYNILGCTNSYREGKQVNRESEGSRKLFPM